MTTATDVWSRRDEREERALPLRWLSGSLWFIRRKPLGAVGAFMVALVLIAGVFAPLIAPYHYSEQNLREKFKSPSREHLMGTDELGRDIFSRIVFGARVYVIIGFTVVAIS